MNKIALKVQQAFETRFGDRPTHLIKAPGRVNLIGEHTDYNGGFVLPLALEEALWIAVRPRKDQAVILHSLDYDDSTEVNLSKPQLHLKGWHEYLSGVIWVLQEENWHLNGWEGVMSGNVPQGAGLSSSAALEIALIRAFSEVSGISWEPILSAKLAQRAESEWVGVNCGIMDQLISACGVYGHTLFIDCRNLNIQQVPLPQGLRLMILDTKTRRGLVDSHYNERHSQCKEASTILGKSLLRDATIFELDDQSTGMESLLYRRAKHVITENERVLHAVDAMYSNDHYHLGQLMYDSHKSLRDDFEVSNSSLDAMVECALTAPGCLGARMTGGGFGGCVVALITAEKEKDFVNCISKCYSNKTNQDPQIISCIPADGASRIDPLTDL
ncbi:galactokinase [Deltaproteobacteria bacterium]|nr:galactokinase [Deltaproteobacteria bacterium]